MYIVYLSIKYMHLRDQPSSVILLFTIGFIRSFYSSLISLLQRGAYLSALYTRTRKQTE